MRRHFLLALALVLTLPVVAQRVPVTGWTFLFDGPTASYPATVPGCIHTDLLANNLIPDPFLLSNEDSVQWVSQRAWQYNASLIVPEELRKRQHIDLVFDGLQTHATVGINGSVALQADNMFRQWRVSLNKDSLEARSWQLDITVVFSPTRPYDEQAQQALGYTLPDIRAFSRTAPYQQGWDWGAVLNSCGIWQPVYLEGWNGRHRPDSEVEAPYAKGFPFKHVVLRQEEDSIGQEFTFVANGKPVFIKGANWIPVHSFPILDSLQRQRYRHLLCSAKEANFNMIRIWGGGIYEPDFFYDLCDSLGLMVWTDFNFSCTLYPADTHFLNNIRQEAEEQVRRLAKHPCVVLWCGNNEVKNGWEDWGWQGQYQWTDAQRQEMQHAIDTIFGLGGVLHQAVQKYAPNVCYHPSSPSFGWGHPECVTHGDSHYWGVWWGELPFEVYREKTGRFMSEYGFMAYPQMSTIDYWCHGQMDAKTNAAEALESPMMKSHQRHARGVQIIDKALMQYYGVESQELTLENYVYYTQLCQAYGTGMGIEAHRMREPHCMGTLYWQLNDCWPVASWSSIDYFGNWKALHYKARDLFAETVILSERITDTTFRFRIAGVPLTKDYLSTLEYVSFSGQSELIGTSEMHFAHPRHQVDSLAWWSDGHTVGLPRQYKPRDGYLRFRFYTTDGKRKTLVAEKVHFLTYPKQMRLPKAKIETKIAKRKGGEYRITISSDVLAKDVQLTAPVPGHFSDNYFDLQPGEKRVVTFQAATPTTADLTITIKCLNNIASEQ